VAAIVGAWLLVAHLRAKRPHDDRASRGGDGATPISAPASSPSGSTPPPAPAAALAEVEGTVRDVLTGAPLAAIDVIFAGEHGETTATSAATGRYRLAVPPGRYQARAAGDEVYGVAPEPLVLEAGARVTTFDLRVARLATVSGRVVEANGQPVAGATITFASALGREEVDSRALEPDGTTQSASDGGFSLRVAPGEVELHAERAGREALARLPSVAPAARLSGIELVFPAAARVAGVVRDEQGPVAGAEVSGAGQRGARARATTAADGSFALSLPVGRVNLQARASKHADSEIAAVDLPASGKEGVQILLRAGLRVRGRILLPDGNPAAGANVQARRSALFDPVQVKADAAGAFTLEDLGPEPVDLVGDLAPFASARLRGVRPPRDGLTLQLRERGRISGTVRAGGQPVVDFTVRVDAWTPAGTDEDIDGWGGVRRLAPDGRFVLDNLQPGTYQLVFAAPGFAPARRGGVVVRAGAETDGSVDLERGATLEGTVRDARTTREVPSARVEALTGREGGDAIYTDEAGRFVLEDVAPGRRSVEVAHPAYLRRSEGGIVLRAGERRRLEVALTPADASKKGGRALEFAGIGAVLSPGDLPRIEGVLPGGPAEVAGLATGDRVAEIDGVPMGAAPLAEVIEAIRGVAGTAVRLAIVRGAERFTVDVVRGNVRFDED